tara:strand:+ start:19380 stop:19742 length:363 start_codon:yes stop_codon:yes gene_type:complete
MNIEDIRRLIETELESYTYDEPEPGAIFGNAWSEDKILSFIPKLRNALVTPYRQLFRLLENGEHMNTEVFEEYWVIAKDKGYVQFYDPIQNEYGLGTESTDGEYVSIGVRGDLVGVYCAM